MQFLKNAKLDALAKKDDQLDAPQKIKKIKYIYHPPI